MNKTKVFSAMVAFSLIAVLSVGFKSCGKVNEEPEPDLSSLNIIGRFYAQNKENGGRDNSHYFEFTTDGSYFYESKNETLNGIYKITEREKGIYDIKWYSSMSNTEVTFTSDAILYKMNASGGKDFDKLYVYSMSDGLMKANFVVHFFYGNKLVRFTTAFYKDI